MGCLLHYQLPVTIYHRSLESGKLALFGKWILEKEMSEALLRQPRTARTVEDADNCTRLINVLTYIGTDIRLLMRRTLASRETGGNRAAPVAQQGPTRSSDASKVSSMHILVPSRLFPSNLRFNVIGHTTEKPDGIRS